MKKKKKNEVEVKKKVKHKYSWAGLGMVLFLSALVIISSFDDIPGLTGSASVAFHRIAYAQQGQQLNFEVKLGGIQSAEIMVLENLKDTNIVFREEGLEEVAYSKIVIESEDADKIGEIELTLKLEEQKLYRVNVNPHDVTVFLNGKEATTTLTEKKGEFVFYKATISKIGEVVIGKVRIEEPVEEPEEVPEPVVEEVVVEPEIPPSSPVEEEKGFFGKIGDFFKELFS